MEYNNNQKETRRHSSLDDPSGKGGHIPCGDNLEEMAERLEEIEALKQAVVTLGQTQKVLLRRVYILEEKQSEIVRRGGQRAAISKRLDRVCRLLKKFFEKS